MSLTTFNTKNGIEVMGEGSTSWLEVIPVGSVVMYAGTTAPEGYLICDGSVVSRTTYADLNAFYSVNAYPFGNGDGSTTFTLPNFSSRMPIGAGSGSGLTARTFAQTGGFEGHTISASNLALHEHTLGGHTHDGTTGNQNASHSHSSTGTSNTGAPSHAHNMESGHTGHFFGGRTDAGTGTARNSNNNGFSGSAANQNIGGGSGNTSNVNADHGHNFGSGTTNSGGSHDHSFTTGGPSNATVASNTSANTQLNHMNPFVGLLFIVKY